MARGRTSTPPSASAARPRTSAEQRKLEQQLRRISRLKQKAERLKARERKTERRPEWQTKSARARKMLKDAESLSDPAEIQRLNDKAELLLKDAERLRKAPPANLIERLSKINTWRKDAKKAMPSNRLIAWHQKYGRWCRNADGTFTGEAHFTLPLKPLEWAEGRDSAREEHGAFEQWFVELISSLKWQDKEPVFWALGFSVGGVDQSGVNRYQRIQGQTGLLSYWYTPMLLGGERGWIGLVNAWKLEVSRIVLEKGLRITKVSFFSHYGPTAPLIGTGEFSCFEQVEPKPKPERKPPTRKPPVRVPGKPVGKKPSKLAYVVYNETARRYLVKKAYSGNVVGLWGSLANAYIFETRQKAQSAASNLNATRPKNRKYRAVVWPVELPA